MGRHLLMIIKKSTLLTKSELTSLLNRTSKSIELFDDVSPQLIDLLKQTKSTDKVSVVVIKK